MADGEGEKQDELKQTISDVVNSVKSEGLFDQFRKECLEQFESMEAYQNLKQRVENHVASFLSKQKFQDGPSKNTLRNSLRGHISKSQVLLNGVDKLVDDVLNIKAQSFCLRVDEQVDKFFEAKEAKAALLEKAEIDNNSTEETISSSGNLNLEVCEDGTDMEIDEVDMEIDNDEKADTTPDDESKNVESSTEAIAPETEKEITLDPSDNIASHKVESPQNIESNVSEITPDSPSTVDKYEYQKDSNEKQTIPKQESHLPKVAEAEPHQLPTLLKKSSKLQADSKQIKDEAISETKIKISEDSKQEKQTLDDDTTNVANDTEEFLDSGNNGRPKRSIKKSWKLKANEDSSDKEEDNEKEAHQKTKTSDTKPTEFSGDTFVAQNEPNVQRIVRKGEAERADTNSVDVTPISKKRRRLGDVKDSPTVAEDEDSNDSNISSSSKKSRGRPKKKRDDKKVVKLQDMLAIPKEKEQESSAATEEIRKSRRGRNVKMPQCYSP